MSVDIREPAVNAVVPHGQALVVDSQQVQHGCVDVVDLRGVVTIQRLVAPLVAFSMGNASLDTSPANQLVNTYGLWSRPFWPCVLGMRPNSVVQWMMVSSSRPRCFRS